ncbi:MAG TPA: RagB/SusD family nutrient uptake outer membrane protein [Porphyromonadaceae bacterium]|jgi:hypothetical protein|nr:RagB/SusD family nutrient uptake outer membrane protein [Porphyromonadaceae bacterium]
MKKIIIVIIIGLFLNLSCKDFLDVVPDNIATIDNAFTSRATAEKYLFTCYSYMPYFDNVDQMAFTIGDEFWFPYPQAPMFFQNSSWEAIAMGNQNVVNPSLNYWDGTNGGTPMYRALRDCNIFLENIYNVPGMYQFEQDRWVAEVKFLKAFYHFWLLRMYGPIPIIKENLPISAGVDKVQVPRESVDSVFSYIISQLDEAIEDLPIRIESEASELGRITKTIALSFKAKVLLEAASPLFNGNSDYNNFTNYDGELLFNTNYNNEKWLLVAEAAKEAIESAHASDHKLHQFVPQRSDLSESTIIKMSVRESVSEEWNSEVIWADPNSQSVWIQQLATPLLDPSRPNNAGARRMLAPPLKIAELFYTKNGVPIEEDKTWNYEERYNVKEVTDDQSDNLIKGYKTAYLHFDREKRFYANLGFDGALWYGQGKYDDKDQWQVKAKLGQIAGKSGPLHSVTGYFPKKLVNYRNIIEAGDGGPYTVIPYPWPVIRLADLYLIYAEAVNEYYGATDEALVYINKVRERAGLKPVQESWSAYSKNPDKYLTQEGLRDIIHQERLIELANEGQRYWDIRRWKRAIEEFNNEPIQGWDIEQQDENLYYRVRTIYIKKFNRKDYLWPISENNLLINKKLVQNPGW